MTLLLTPVEHFTPTSTSVSPSPNSSALRATGQLPESSARVGRFGRMFRTAPAAGVSQDELRALGDRLVVASKPTPQGESNAQENPAIPAGYSFLGQFLDHDIDLTPMSR